MTEKMQVYKCSVCGNTVEVLHQGGGSLICCGAFMKLFEENSVDASPEKHVPVFEKKAGLVHVRVGSVPHPMEEDHLIEWIEVMADGRSYRQFLKPGQAPEASFAIQAEEFTVREYCNLHGLWKA